MATTIQPLKKVTLSLTVKSGPGTSDSPAPPIALVFVFGAAGAGLCPFETTLHGREAGARLAVRVKVAEAPDYFGHLFHPLWQGLGDRLPPDTLELEIEVTAITDASDREVVQAAAQALAHGGCGGSCGCGCGC